MHALLSMPLAQKYRIKNRLFSIAWCLLLIQVLIIDGSIPTPPFRITAPMFLLLAFSAVFPFDYSLREMAMIAISGVIALLICYTTKRNISFWVVAFVAASKGIRLRPLFQKTLLVYCIIFVLSVVLSQLGIIDDYVRTNGQAPYLKHSLGMGDANGAHAKFLIIVCLLSVTLGERLQYKHLFIGFLLNTLLFLATFSKTSAAIVYLVLLLLTFEKLLRPYLSDRIYNSLMWLWFLALIAIVAFVTIAPVYFHPDSPFFMAVNRFFTGRFALSHAFLERYSIRPFGNFLYDMYTSPRVMYLDNGYHILLLEHGLIFASAYIIGCFALFWKFWHRHDFAKVVVITAVLLFLTTENLFTIIFYNFTYFWFRDFIFRNQPE